MFESGYLRLCNKVLAESSTAIHLLEQRDRLESALDSNDIPLALDASKAFLESLFKTIISDRVANPKLEKNFMPLYTEVRSLIPLCQDNGANEMLHKIGSSLIHNLGELRNAYGAASHGDDGYYQNPIERPEVDMIVSAVDGLAACLYTKHKTTLIPHLSQRIRYEDYADFNDWLDEQFTPYEIPLSPLNIIQVMASEVLFKQDHNSYREMLLQYIDSQKEDLEL